MRRLLVAVFLVMMSLVRMSQPSNAESNGPGACFRGQLGGTIDCGGGYVVPVGPRRPLSSELPSVRRSIPVVPAVGQAPLEQPTSHLAVANPCVQLGPSTPGLNAAVVGVLAILTCRGAPGPPPGPVATPAQAIAARTAPAIDPGELAVQFWQTIPLPVPHPSIPPNYAVTGMPAYLVTNGTLAPSPYQRQTPLGPLRITARGSYLVDWGDSTSPDWAGPYKYEGRPYPDGNISHTYDNVGTVTVTVQEVWTATWRLGAASGQLTELRTTATIHNFEIKQVQSILTG